METLITIIRQYAEWIYAVCGFIALYNIYQTWQIRAARRQAVFTLERKKATDDLYKILFAAFVLIGAMGATYFVSNTLAARFGLPKQDRSILNNFPQLQGLPAGESGGAAQPVDESGNVVDSGELTAADSGAGEGTTTGSTAETDASGGDSGANTENNQVDSASGSQADGTGSATDGAAAASSNGASNSNGANNSAATNSANPAPQSEVSVGTLPTPTQPVPTPTFTYAPPPPPPTITPTTAPIVSPPSCPDARTRISSPGNGAIVNGSFNIMGTVAHEQMQFYKIEYAPGTSTNQEFVYLSGGNDPINGGVLATVDSTIWYNGVWTIKVTVVDNTGNFPPPCTVAITVNN